jgi:cytochrome P450
MATTGYEIKKGWHVNIDATCIHYDSDLFIDPLKFNPQRFDVTSSLFLFSLLDCFLPVSEKYFTYLLFIYLQEMQKPYSFIPFGSGPRTCLGMNMAKVTMLVFLHRLTSGYT